MAIDLHVLNFLRAANRRKPLDRAVTIGRQELYLPDSILAEAGQSKKDDPDYIFCEKLICEHLGAKTVDSIDNSAYQQASIIHDMNQPLPDHLFGAFDTVIDGGCLEHIFNVPQALKNCSLLSKEGGQIIHILPTNNFCGHGFWQMSPELFFSLYSTDNGYAETQVFVTDVNDTTKWFKVKRPRPGGRVDIVSRSPMYVMVRTVLARTDFTHDNVQQSDYRYAWENQNASVQAPPEAEESKPRPSWWRTTALANKIRTGYYEYLRATNPSTFYSGNPGLEAVDPEGYELPPT